MRQILASLVLGGLALAAWFAFERYEANEHRLLEGQARAQLQEIRESVAKSLADQEPLTALEDPPTLWPALVVAMPHEAGSGVILVSSRTPRDSGYWAYDRDSQRVYIDCTHSDSSGKKWVDY